MVGAKNARLRLLPSVHEAVKDVSQNREINDNYSSSEITRAVRNVLEKARFVILDSQDNDAGDFTDIFLNLDAWLNREVLKELKSSSSTLKRVINATGVVLHTNCGRALLAAEAADFAAEQAKHYSNLELDIATGKRGLRYIHAEDLLTELTGAESALVVNNNAAAVLLIMNTFAREKEVIVSRGELVEVGGSFRIPEVLIAGGARLREVGTTNKTWLKDYRQAVNPDTAMLLKVHTSNYRIEGFYHAVETKELVKLGEELGLPVIEDLGSGSLLDGVELGLPKEPTIQEAVRTGASLVSFSGDKLLGGPQAGIILGKKEYIKKLQENQLTRALRVDKLTLAALAGTLRLYLIGEVKKIPVWGMLFKTKDELEQKTLWFQKKLKDFMSIDAQVEDNYSRVGGGAFPTAALPTSVCSLRSLKSSANELESFLRQGEVPILTRIFKDKVLLDPRTLLADDYQEIIRRLDEWEKVPMTHT